MASSIYHVFKDHLFCSMLSVLNLLLSNINSLFRYYQICPFIKRQTYEHYLNITDHHPPDNSAFLINSWLPSVFISTILHSQLYFLTKDMHHNSLRKDKALSSIFLSLNLSSTLLASRQPSRAF